ncbi:hypothetical protein F4809DRAFT_105374 [Biscogniauxia mediterranea]|nr:hypothetical protein F4809DRAFT_105374 [Biscogniauxia mediterranea]
MQESTSYSTLEVGTPDPEFHQKEVVAYPDHSYPQALPAEQQPTGGPTTYNSETGKEVVYVPDQGYYKPDGSPYSQNAGYVGAYDPQALNAAGSPHPYAAVPATGLSPMNGAHTEQGDQHSQYAQNGAPNEKTPKATICGLPKRTFYIVLAIAIIVTAAAIAGGVAGGLTANRSRDSSSSSSSSSSSGSTDGEQHILTDSKLTATNWTDSDGTVYRTIFFQDAYASLIARRWDSKGNTWTTDNLTDMYIATTRPIDSAAGTPLASASIALSDDNAYETHLWFLNEDNIIRSMAATDALNAPSTWTNDTLDEAVLETWAGGQLAAAWQRCWADDCDGAWIVAYQRPEGAIKTANSTTWATATVAVDSSNVAANSSLAIIPQLNGARLDRLELISEDVSSSSTGTMGVTTYNDTWTGSDDRVTELLTGIPQPNVRQQFAVTKWDAWNQALYLALLVNGTVEGTHWDGSQMNALSSIEFNQGPDVNFTAIAMTTDAMFYGISNDEILEYSVDQTNPSTLNYVSTVYP